jgi:acetyl/propionyl-CoA carboxylase alpha subunit
MTAIAKLLIANRGEIASRVVRTARTLDIATVAIFSTPDADAPFVRQADEAVHLPGERPADTYLDIAKIIAAASVTGADAVHPGYGFLSERADFARACASAGLVFVGPPPEVIDSMGSKTAAKQLMADAGVPVLPGLVVDNDTDIGTSLLGRAAEEVGFPLLVKAVYGGGGRGMRIVRSSDDLLEAVQSAQREAQSAFGDGSVFLEHFVDTPRHIEVQIFGDSHGDVVHLFERECSIQRRYQKVIEECPSPVVDAELRTRLGNAAIAAGKAIGYVGAGTVEFVLDRDRNFFFLEVNTRLQVEHPVTEMVTGLDLVALQLRVAEGAALPDEVRHASISGHAIEVRLYAEDVVGGFLPVTGVVHHFDVPAMEGIRVDSGITDGSIIGVQYDSMMAKVIAHGADRDQARRRLARALATTILHGPSTNRELLVGILREEEFAAGDIDTGYLARHDVAELIRSRQGASMTSVHSLAAALAAQHERRQAARVLATIPSGWRNVPSEAQQCTYVTDDEEVRVRYSVHSDIVEASIDGQDLGPVVLHALSNDMVEFEVGGVRRIVSVGRVGETAFVDSALGSSILHELPRFPDVEDTGTPGSLTATMPGTVARINVEAGQVVEAGDTILAIEAMKMEHAVAAPHGGIVSEVSVSVGEAVQVGTVLAIVLDQHDNEAQS